jgi:hypothetical protein
MMAVVASEKPTATQLHVVPWGNDGATSGDETNRTDEMPLARNLFSLIVSPTEVGRAAPTFSSSQGRRFESFTAQLERAAICPRALDLSTAMC